MRDPLILFAVRAIIVCVAGIVLAVWFGWVIPSMDRYRGVWAERIAAQVMVELAGRPVVDRNDE